YSPAAAPCAEPTALACLALSARGMEADAFQASRSPNHSSADRRIRLIGGLALLARLQRPDGSVSVALNIESPCWPTGLAVLAWSFSDSIADPPSADPNAHPPTADWGCLAAPRYRPQTEKAVDWLLHSSGKPIAPNPTVYGHDTTLRGWSWVENTHAWVEPTAYAILALRGAGKGEHPRVREGIQMVLDRAIPNGGWNYGNPRVYKNTLRPFPGPTGIALTALAGQPSDSRIEAGIAYLSHELRRVRSPMSLGWGLIGLTAWGRRPDEASVWLEECARRALCSAPNAMYDALLLLADLDPCPITPRSLEVATNG
ncbi:MAG: hypothetical protein AAB385_11645, partial [Planctomycetota bacterium]